MLLTGTYERALDEKQRLPLPKRLKAALRDEEQTLFITPGTDGSLMLFAAAAFAKLADRLAAQSPTAQDVRAFARLLYAQTQSVELDRQGRFRVPPELARLAGLGRECVLVGAGDHIELWNRERWSAYLEEQQPRYDQLAESALSGQSPAAASRAADRLPPRSEIPQMEETPLRPMQPR